MDSFKNTGLINNSIENGIPAISFGGSKEKYFYYNFS